jgi:hypothetical protein
MAADAMRQFWAGKVLADHEKHDGFEILRRSR